MEVKEAYAVKYTPEEVSDYIEVKSYPEELKTIAGKQYKLAAVSTEETAIYARETDLLARHAFPEVHESICQVAPIVWDLVRAVKIETKQEYKGMASRGSELTVILMRPADFGWTTWLKSYGATGATHFIPDTAETRALNQYTAEAIVAFTDFIDVPKIDALSFSKEGETFVEHELPFEILRNTERGPICVLKEPLVALPRSEYNIDLNVFATGDDKLRPIALKVVQAKNVIERIAP